jgi:phage virion morphogenesis protein
MTGVSVTMTSDLGKAIDGLARAQTLLAQPRPLLRQIGVLMVHSTQARFNTGRDPKGHPWKPLLPAYAAGKRGTHILIGAGMSGGLQGSLTFDTGANQVQWGSNKIYAAVHQFGARIVPKNAKALAFRLAGALVLSKGVTIPARPYLGISVHDEAEIVALTARRFGQALDRR